MVAIFDEFGQHLLGCDYPVTIEFLRPGRIRVRSGPRDVDIMMTREEMQRIVEQFRSEVGNATVQSTPTNGPNTGTKNARLSNLLCNRELPNG